MIACSVSGHRQLARKLDVFLTSLCEAMSNLELELMAVLHRLGLDRRNVKDMFGVPMNYLSPFFINFYRGMGLLTEAEKRKFPLEKEIAGSDDESVSGDNEVVNDENNIEHALPSAEVDKSKDDIEEQLAKRQQKLQMHSALKIIG
ncbi:hypothetical protein AXG93_2834s1150 [Marchantia polymorpha subsp. ruderalis]|uniref:Uncharacterized protein n=1 Tax=Marchantia polymorpha subsp. ruderalis TaxID=1480154 RepID=A0A176WG60_MARPO|nr:hypothetical protein AXG93_2834s1150 [Marchantia polymorpha subsp. ruderalis]